RLTLIDPDRPQFTARLELADVRRFSNFRAAAFTPDGKTLVTAGEGAAAVRFWDVPAAGGGEEARPCTTWRLPGRVCGLAVSPCGGYVATGNGNGTIYVLAMPVRPQKKQ